jgi:hypothetical protein
LISFALKYLIKNIKTDIKIIKQETLNTDMYALGYTDFNVFANPHGTRLNYYNYLSFYSVFLINDFYADDFKIFDYEMIQTNEQLLELQSKVTPTSTSTPTPSRNVKSNTFKKMGLLYIK